MGKQEAKLIFGLQRLGLTFWRGEKSKEEEEEEEEEEEGEGEEVQKNSGEKDYRMGNGNSTGSKRD